MCFLLLLLLQADEGPQLYWQFLDSLDLDSSSSTSSTACWHSIIDQASQLCLPQVAKVCPVVCWSVGGCLQYLFAACLSCLHATT